MGTAGPIGLARAILDDGSGQPFFVLNRRAYIPCYETQLHLHVMSSVSSASAMSPPVLACRHSWGHEA